MKAAIWLIAICEVIRAMQNAVQLKALFHDTGKRDDAYQAFIDSLKASDKEFVRKMLEKFEREEGEV